MALAPSPNTGNLTRTSEPMPAAKRQRALFRSKRAFANFTANTKAAMIPAATRLNTAAAGLAHTSSAASAQVTTGCSLVLTTGHPKGSVPGVAGTRAG